MKESKNGRIRTFSLESEEGPARGGLYELEQVTTFRVIDNSSGEVVLTLEGGWCAGFDRDSGTWGEVSFNGVSGVMIGEEGNSVIVQYFDGHEETIPLI